MSRKRIKPQKRCTKCHSEAGILLITLPKNVFLRPRTEAAEKVFRGLIDAKSLTFDDIKLDQRRRRLHLCPDCIKPYRKKYGFTKRGDAKPVGMWGQKNG